MKNREEFEGRLNKSPRKQRRIFEKAGGGRNFADWPEYIPLCKKKLIRFVHMNIYTAIVQFYIICVIYSYRNDHNARVIMNKSEFTYIVVWSPFYSILISDHTYCSSNFTIQRQFVLLQQNYCLKQCIAVLNKRKLLENCSVCLFVVGIKWTMNKFNLHIRKLVQECTRES